MTIDEAVKVLNEHRHNGVDDWVTYGHQFGVRSRLPWDFRQSRGLTEYEAVAVAMRYVADQKATEKLGEDYYAERIRRSNWES